MEKIVLDGVPLTLDEDGNVQVYERISSILTDQNRVIASVAVDGVEMSPEAFVSLEGGTSVEFVSMDVRELVVQTLGTAGEYVVNVRKGALSVADMLESEKVEQAMNLSVQVMEGMDWLLTAVGRCTSLLGCTPDEGIFGDFQDARQKVAEKMESVVDSFEAGKLFAPAFVFREEIPPLIDVVQNTIAALEGQVTGRRQ